jgi:DNA-binding FadR family transcriptional regulator
MSPVHLDSEFLEYLSHSCEMNGVGRLPALAELSKQLNVSISTLREQMEVARALGLVEARPRTGIRRLEYSFFPAVRQSLMYALALDRNTFESFASLRRHLEASYWFEATALLTPEDHTILCNLVSAAWEKLKGTPIQIPQAEHRELHLSIFRRLDNPFVLGILEAYWEAYEAVGLDYYTDYNYLQQVWDYHNRMVEAICDHDYATGYQALIEHADLIYHRP